METSLLNIHLLSPLSRITIPAFNDTGYELYVHSIRYHTEIERHAASRGDMVQVGFGVKVEIPENHIGLITLLPSASKFGVSLVDGIHIVYPSYKQELRVGLYQWDTNFINYLAAGEKIAQLNILPYLKTTLNFVN